MFYIYVENNKLNGCGTCKNPEITNFQTDEALYTDYLENPLKYIWNGKSVVLNPNYEQEQIQAKKDDLNNENTAKAKQAVENGYVEYKNAEFETNAQTVGDLTATMLLMQASGLESYQWLSKDDQVVELALNDFGILGGLIAGYKAHIWNDEYMGYKTQIEEAQTMEELNAIVIDYEVEE